MIRKLLKLTPDLRSLLMWSVGLGLAGGAFLILEALWLANVTDRAFLGGEGLHALLPSMGVLLLWILLRVAVHMAGDAVSLRMAGRIKEELRMRLLRKLVELGPAYAKGERSGELVSTVYEGVEQLETYLARYVPQAALSMLIPGAVGIAVLGMDRMTAVILGVTLPLLIFFMILVGLAAKAKTEKQLKTLGILSGHFLDVVKGLPTLKIFNRSKAQIAIIERISEDYRRTTMGTLRLAFLSAFVMELFATLCTAIVAVFLGLRLISGDIDFHRAYAVLLLTPEFYAPVRALGVQFHAGMNGRTAADRIFEILAAEPVGWVEREDALRLQLACASEREALLLAFDGVSVRYPDSERDALHRVTFEVKRGETVAIIGHTGAGKSTLIDVLQGFVRPTEGHISVGGVDMAELSMSWWRSQLAVVAQRSHLFQGTIADNIRLGRPEATMGEVVEAARLAQADAFILALPDGYETRIGEAVRLSGGQIRRIAIARALLRRAPVLVLDEPTAQLDLENDALVQASWKQGVRGGDHTVIVIAHRLQTIRDADRIVVLRHGCVAEVGSPQELLRRGGLYAEMLEAYEAGTVVSSS